MLSRNGYSLLCHACHPSSLHVSKEGLYAAEAFALDATKTHVNQAGGRSSDEPVLLVLVAEEIA